MNQRKKDFKSIRKTAKRVNLSEEEAIKLVEKVKNDRTTKG